MGCRTFHLHKEHYVSMCLKWIITENENINQNTYGHNGPRPCPSLYTNYYCTTVLCENGEILRTQHSHHILSKVYTSPHLCTTEVNNNINVYPYILTKTPLHNADILIVIAYSNHTLFH